MYDLGYAERHLLDLEKRIAFLAPNNSAKDERDFLICECSAHSKLWIFGLYEVLRTFKDQKSEKFDALKSLFRDLEIARMPLAKHMIKSAPGFRDNHHYPTGGWRPDTGMVGWSMFDPYEKKMRFFYRTMVSAVAVPPSNRC
ncbi:hypothetical protein MJC1_04138 [Methylocystis sp. MJC1]|nr:hypothetical protein MJC1_04138 [Methylocystis sp. MJC1]